MRQSKQQTVMDLDIGVYLRTSEIKAFTLLHFLTYPLSPSSPALCSPGLNVPPHREVAAGQGRTGRKPCWVMLCCCLRVPVSGVSSQGLWSSSSTCLHAGLWSLGSSPTSRIFSPVRFFTTFFLRPPAPWFPSLYSQCAEANAWSASNWWFCFTSFY